MTSPISSNPPPSKHTSLEAQNTASVQKAQAGSQKGPPSLMFFVAEVMLETLGTITRGMVVRSKTVSQNQADAQAALQANSALHLVQVHQTTGPNSVALGQFTLETNSNRQIEQIRLVNNGFIQQMNSESSQVMTRESGLGHSLSMTYQQATGILQTIVKVSFAANLTSPPQ